MVLDTFEDLVCRQRSRELAGLIYRLTQKAISKKDFGLTDQVRRAAVSVMSSIAEGFGRGGNKELVRFSYSVHRGLSLRSAHFVM